MTRHPIRPASAGPRPPVAWWIASGASLALLGGLALAHGEASSLGWYAGNVAWALGVTWVAAARPGATLGTAFLAAALAGTTVLAILAGFEVWTPWGPAERVALYAGHPNLLAASLVATTAALLAVRGDRPAWERAGSLAIPLVALAVLVTGSRAGLAALGAAWVVWLAAPGRGRAARIGALAAVAVLAGLVGVARLQAAREAENPNLLRDSADLTGPTWRTAEDARVVVTPDAAPGPASEPGAGTRAVRVEARTRSGRLALRHVGLGRSEAGRPYVASVYLRAEEPRRLDLATNLGRTTCRAEARWSRCVLPVTGDGSTYLQFRLATTEPGGAFDVLVYGPQLERSETVSAYAPTGTGLLGVALLRRLDPGEALEGDPRRAAAAGVAWRAFTGSPWTGVGREGVRAALREADPSLDVAHLTHVHNVFLQRLAAEGALGLLAWAALFGPPYVGAFRRSARAVAPLAVALVVLNAVDATLFHGGVIVPMWFAVGATWLARTERQPGAKVQGSVGGA